MFAQKLGEANKLQTDLQAFRQDLSTTQRYMHLSPAAKESAIRLLELDVRGEKRGEIRESSTASEENGREISNVMAVAHGNRTHRGRLSAPATGFEDRAPHQSGTRYRRGS